jgi:RNA polymerase sigma factor (sigma-70 family)
MPDANDMDLVREFARNNSEAAFAELVRRHLNLVYSVARRCTGNDGDAHDVTQAVFIILARKAAGLREKTLLTGWLYETTRFAAARLLRTNARRHAREQEAYMQSTLTEADTAAVWEQLSPHLEAAMGRLNAADRALLVLRFYENKTGPEAAALLGIREDAAHKRVARAIEKLRKFFAQRGVTLSGAAIAGAVSANSVQAAPVALVKTISTIAVAKGAAAGTSTLTIVKGALKIMAWTKMQTAIVAGICILITVGTATLLISRPIETRHPREILTQTCQKYASLSSYSGTSESIEKIDNKIITASSTFRLGRTNLYFLECEQHAPTFTNRMTAWSDGSGDYWLARDRVVKNPFSGPAFNLGDVAQYISCGASVVVPAVFFDSYISPQTFAAWRSGKLVTPTAWLDQHPIMQPDETVGKTDCYVISIETDEGNAKLWIGKQDFLIHQSEQMVKIIEPDFTDEDTKRFFAGVIPELGKMALSQFHVQIYTGGVESLSLPLKEVTRRINNAKHDAYHTMKPVAVVFSEVTNVSALKSVLINPPKIILFTQNYDNIALDQKFLPSDFHR